MVGRGYCVFHYESKVSAYESMYWIHPLQPLRMAVRLIYTCHRTYCNSVDPRYYGFVQAAASFYSWLATTNTAAAKS